MTRRLRRQYNARVLNLIDTLQAILDKEDEDRPNRAEPMRYQSALAKKKFLDGLYFERFWRAREAFIAMVFI